MLRIGSLEIANRVIAAPMAGLTDQAFRVIAREFGCGMVFSEMISDKGLVYGQARTLRMIDAGDEARPFGVQIFGSQPDTMAQAAQLVEKAGADLIDINMGCPTPKIVKNGEGAALLLDLPRCRDIIQAIAKAVSIPITIKMRRGWEDGSLTCLELAVIAEEAGAQALTLHPRSRTQFFSGKADWDLIRQIKQRVNIPVIGNGDIWTANDAQHMLESTGCDAVMIGRGALGNPSLYRESVSLVEHGIALPPATLQERLQVARKHLHLVCSLKQDYTGVREMRKHIAWYIKGLPGAAKMREEVNRATSKDEIDGLLEKCLIY
ncbi:MAG TPA: tRNA dihydrouridine synthase DusB [Syntrophomonadaceae bacterium]|nr:tRNA dihydrouridine synthase DusB [Syntrophomonadaceae bacterium]